MKQIAVSFTSGRDVLNAYWGFLSNGGLVIPDEDGLHEGEPVAVEVTIESSRRRYTLNGHVVRGAAAESARDRAVIAFAPGEPHDLLLSAAWAETDNVPLRRHRRFPIDATLAFREDGGAERRGRILNLSMGGCCLRAKEPLGGGMSSGDRVVVLCDGVEVTGVIRWVGASDVGIEFEGERGGATVESLLRQIR